MRMRQLHTKCGGPTAAGMRKAIKDFDVPRVAPASLSEFFSDKRPNALPKQDFLRGFVAACLLSGGTAPDLVTAELRTWDAWWGALVLASGTPPITVTPRVPDIAGTKPHRRRPLLITTSFVAGLLLGAALALAIPRLVRLLDSHPHTLRVQVDHPPPFLPTGGDCPTWEAAIRDGHGVPLGTIWLQECADRLDILTVDNLADDYCVFSVIHWSNGASQATPRTCAAGHLSYSMFDKRTPGFRLEFFAVR
jgi:hypothetical protein